MNSMNSLYALILICFNAYMLSLYAIIDAIIIAYMLLMLIANTIKPYRLYK